MENLESRVGETRVDPSEKYLIAQAKKYRTEPVYIVPGQYPQPDSSQQNTIVPLPQDRFSGHNQIKTSTTSVKSTKLNPHTKSTFWALASILFINVLGALATVYCGHKALRDMKHSNNNKKGKVGVYACLGLAYFFLVPFAFIVGHWLLAK